MNDKPTTEAGAAAGSARKTGAPEPANVLVETLVKRVKIRTAIVTGRPNFRITQREADELVQAGKARIVDVKG